MLSSNPIISIIFPSYNGAKFLKRNLDSIKTLDNLNEIELIIIDNKSKDSSINIIKSYDKEINLKLIKNKVNVGFAEACNFGVRNSNGEFIFITNQDVIFPHDFFEKLKQIYYNYKSKHEIVISPALVFENGNIHYFGAKIHFLGFSYTPELGLKLPKDKIIKITQRLSGGSVFIKKKLFLDIGGFDKEFFMYYEDTDLSLKILRNGNKIYTTNDPFLIHQKNQQTLSRFKYYFLERNRFILLIKNIKEIYKLIPFILITELILLVHSFFIKKLKVRLKIYLELILKAKSLKILRNKVRRDYHLLSYNKLSKTLDPILLGDLGNFKVFRILFNLYNKFLKQI